MDGPTLFESMYSDDAEGQKMKEMPGVDELMMIYPFLYCTLDAHLVSITKNMSM